MQGIRKRPGQSRLSYGALLAVGCVASLCCHSASAQTTAGDPVATPSNTAAARPGLPAPNATHPISSKQAREADDAYIAGAKNIEHDDLVDAEKNFERAIQLNPGKQEYALSLAITREHHLTELVQAAAKARLIGDNGTADNLLQQARKLDPDNGIVTQHLGVDASPLPTVLDARGLPGSGLTNTLASPVELAPTPGEQPIHIRGTSQDVIRQVYSSFGISVVFDPSVTTQKTMRIDLDSADFETATRVVSKLTGTFAVTVQPKSALIAKDTQAKRDELVTQVEETIYIPGLTAESMTELATLARTVFDLKNVTASPTEGEIVIRADEPSLKLVNATYADLLDGGSDVLLDIKLYEIDKTHDVNIGGQLPTSISFFSVAAELQQIVNQNQSLINELLQSGVLMIPQGATYYQQLFLEAIALLGSGAVSAPQFTNLLGVFGSYGSYVNAAGKLVGIPLAGAYLTGSGVFNLLLNSSDVRTLDALQVRAGNNQPSNFRAGSRYPIETGTYSSGASSSLLAGLGSAATSALAALGITAASASVTIPQIQYEDLGLTLKTTPQILRSGDVRLQLDLKIEALGGGTVNGIPILDNRTLTSTITVPIGQTALIASSLNRNETRSIEGLPGLSEIPGFEGTEKNTEIDSSQLIITVTPHVVREGNIRVASRRLAYPSVPPEN